MPPVEDTPSLPQSLPDRPSPFLRQINAFPRDWDGRPGKTMRVVIKRKVVDTQAIYAVFKSKPDVPLCAKCRMPCNHAWRDRRVDQAVRCLRRKDPPRRSQRVIAPARPAVGTVTEGGGDEHASASHAHVLALDRTSSPLRTQLLRGLGSLKRVTTRLRQKLEDDDDTRQELWYGKKFQRQLKAFYKPEIARPSLPERGRYPCGARVECFAERHVWYPGRVVASRDNETYDVRFDNGDVARHVFAHMIRFGPTREDSKLACSLYGTTLAAAVVWPLVGFRCASSGGTARETSAGVQLAAAPALILGLVNLVAVGSNVLAIYRSNSRAGVCLTARYVSIFALPPASLTLAGAMVMAKGSGHPSACSWVQALLLPASLFSLTGSVYAHVVSPAYGRAWRVASAPWLLFLLMLSVRLDGAAGDASPPFARVPWMVVFAPLWVLLSMFILGHHALPLVWEMEGCPEPAGVPGWVPRLVAFLPRSVRKGAAGVTLAARGGGASGYGVR